MREVINANNMTEEEAKLVKHHMGKIFLNFGQNGVTLSSHKNGRVKEVEVSQELDEADIEEAWQKAIYGIPKQLGS